MQTASSRHLDELDEGLQDRHTQPERGKMRDDVRPGSWSQLVRRHVLFYTFTDEAVLVQRVLHGSTDPTVHLPHDESAI